MSGASSMRSWSSHGRYAMDLDALRAKLTPRTKVVFLCSPHNPGGTVWSAEEIVRSPPSASSTT